MYSVVDIAAIPVSSVAEATVNFLRNRCGRAWPSIDVPRMSEPLPIPNVQRLGARTPVARKPIRQIVECCTMDAAGRPGWGNRPAAPCEARRHARGGDTGGWQRLVRWRMPLLTSAGGCRQIEIPQSPGGGDLHFPLTPERHDDTQPRPVVGDLDSRPVQLRHRGD